MVSVFFPLKSSNHCFKSITLDVEVVICQSVSKVQRNSLPQRLTGP